ncbi:MULTISPECIES: DMT family transporter [Pontibacillus]|uniref:Multidrug efflux SMR transporter n=1 Tax=Pontibacillus chungwhensis TaxID=265426 RepID=A0ABY8V263_9BACI|nr:MULTISPECIES: multidrug efflux SMR transporter [Pontibacillus]MCD5322244.1 multidrug efflux SMR transporter [Pontibacillus sp. HN14]WIF99538.1 multidrug efflux SMR transporter [Pontibacillus chungwhensis]
MAWIQLIFAGIAEVSGVTFLKMTDGFKKKGYVFLMLVAGVINFYLLSKAIETLPIGTAYGVWTGIGSIGTVVIGMIFFRESKEWLRLLFISMIVIGIVGLKVTTA